MSRITLFIFLFTCQVVFSQNDNEPNSIYVCPPCNSDCDALTYEQPGICNHCSMRLISKEESKQLASERKKIAFYLQDGVEVLDFAGPMEVFSYAGFEVFTVSKTRDTIISQGILRIIPDYDINDAPQANVLAFFGGNASKAYQDPEVIEWVKNQTDIEYYFSVCTGAFILAEAGILENKTATTFHSALNGLENNYPDVKVLKDVRYVDNGNIITTAGISAGIDGALHLVARILGFNKARKVAYDIEYDKWTPGEGLLTTNENPYLEFMRLDNFGDYLGTYEFENDLEVAIKFNERENSIYAVLDGQNFPLFYIKQDVFTAVNGEEVTFQRNEEGAITGYRNNTDDTSFFKKLN
ncbi:DJ-1/PfpI family protein [Flavobacteriaceae bacterium M23B6Z8]